MESFVTRGNRIPRGSEQSPIEKSQSWFLSGSSSISGKGQSNARRSGRKEDATYNYWSSKGVDREAWSPKQLANFIGQKGRTESKHSTFETER